MHMNTHHTNCLPRIQVNAWGVVVVVVVQGSCVQFRMLGLSSSDLLTAIASANAEEPSRVAKERLHHDQQWVRTICKQLKDWLTGVTRGPGSPIKPFGPPFPPRSGFFVEEDTKRAGDLLIAELRKSGIEARRDGYVGGEMMLRCVVSTPPLPP
jgi:hypothetical protein